MTSIYVPGKGNVSLRKGTIDSELHAYDERLFFAQHPDNGQWTVFVKIDRDLDPDVGAWVEGEHAYPVLAFPFNRNPDNLTADEIMAKVHAADTLRHGQKMLDELHAHNARIKKEKDDAASEAAAVYAEGVESYLRGHKGDDLKFTKVYMNGNQGRNTAIRTG